MSAELQPLPDGYREGLARCRFVTVNLEHSRLWAYTDHADLAKLLGAGAPYRRCSEPELYEYEITSTHPDAVALACELAEVPRA